MSRRRFLLTSVAALAALTLSLPGCGDDDGVPPPFAQMQWITRDPQYSDYRPAVDGTGTQVVFERTPVGGGALTSLYLATGINTSTPVVAPFLKVPANPPPTYPYLQTRPDWSWVVNEIAFTGAVSSTTAPDVHIVPPTGSPSRLVAGTRGFIYPIWSSDGTQLIVDNGSATASPVAPVTSLITPTGEIVTPNLNGNNANNVAMFGGFAAPMPGNAQLIAYAGQPALANWGLSAPPPAGTTPTYDQDNNYVFLNALGSDGKYTSAPLEPAASISTFNPAYQGRAPYWSPNGKYIVFESSRAGGYALFLANVANVATGAAPVQLTDESYWAQHAKFLPGGSKLVFTALQRPSTQDGGARGIAIIDISALL